MTFDNLQPEGLDPDPARQAQYRSCCDEAQAFADNPQRWLAITGPSGCGKTHLAAAIANRCIANGMPTFWAIVPELLDHLRATFGPTSDVTYDELFERVKNASLLMLDDLSLHSATPWAKEKLFQILNHRFNARFPTVVTTISIDDLDERLQTRLRSFGLSEELKLKLQGPSLFNQIGGISPEIMSAMRFRNFDIQGMNADREGRASLKYALEAARQFAEAPEGWLVLVGPAGSGKTHLAAAIANRQKNSNRPVLFANVPELLERLRTGSRETGKAKDGISLMELKTSPVLVLDDLSMENLSAWAREKLQQVLNYRYSANLATVITATDPDMESLGSRLRSRIEDPKISNVIPIGAPDYRGGRANTKPTLKKRL